MGVPGLTMHLNLSAFGWHFSIFRCSRNPIPGGRHTWRGVGVVWFVVWVYGFAASAWSTPPQ